jgi:CDP-diacylglycerol--glycerol-3-phosphate 3-phosphatidyltransferase
VDFPHRSGQIARAMTTANKVTIGRILLVPFFIASLIYYFRTGMEWYRWAAIGCFAVAAISDGIDGFIARHFNQWSELGTILDPLADKLLLVSGIVLLSFPHAGDMPGIPIWLTVIILSRDVLLLIGYWVVHFLAGGMKVKPHFLGKIATVLQMAAVLWALFMWDARWHFNICVAAAVLTTGSGLIYLFDWMRQVAKHPSSSPSRKDGNEP